MRRHSPWTFYNTLGLIHHGAIVIAATFAAGQKIDASSWHPGAREWIEWFHRWNWAVIPALTFISYAARGIQKAIGPPWVWKAVQKILDEYRGAAFEVQENDALHHYRVTLFKRVTWRTCAWSRLSTWWAWGWWRWPWSGWLVPIARSGHTTQNSKAIFLAPDDADEAEGIAGQAWAREGVIVQAGLPDVNSFPSAENVAEYARRTFVTEGWVRSRLGRRSRLSLSLCAIPLEVNGERWGVIVLDSMKPDALKRKSHTWDPYRKLIPIALSQILQGR